MNASSAGVTIEAARSRAGVVTANIRAGLSVVHVINAILLPPLPPGVVDLTPNP